MNGTDPAWADRALRLVLGRVGSTAEQIGSRFPLYADPETGRWITTARGSWTAGFWAGLLWLRALMSGDGADVDSARACTDRLDGWVDQDTAARGMILWYGTALADQAAHELRARAARACLAAFDPALGVVPWGSALGGPRLAARADSAPGTVPLLALAAQGGVEAAHTHLTQILRLCLSEQPPRPAWVAAPGGGWRGCEEPAPGWSRTAAWLLLAVADGMAVPEIGRTDALSEAAEALGAARLADGVRVVPWAAGSGGALDTSAAAIEAVAALKLAWLARAAGETGGADRLAARAEMILRQLCTEHLSAPGDPRPAGMLLDGCYDARRGLAVRHELVWGDFFLALGLAILGGLVEPFAT